MFNDFKLVDVVYFLIFFKKVNKLDILNNWLINLCLYIVVFI